MPRPFDLLVVGELNVDIIISELHGFPVIGKEIFADNLKLVMGSSSAIFAANAASLLLKVAFAGKLGNDEFGKLILEQLKQRNINTDAVDISQEWATGATIALNYSNDRAMITYRGAMAHFGMEDINPNLLKQARHLHASSVFLQPKLKNNIVDLFKLAKEAGMSTSLDPQWDPTEEWDMEWEELLPFVDYFLPNALEILAITGSQNLEAAVTKLSSKAQTIIIKNGIDGSLMYRKGKLLHQPAFLNNKLVDAIGAGDSYDAGFIAGLLHGLTEEESLKLAALCGAINTTAPGGTAAFNNLNDIRNISINKFNTFFPL